MLNIFILFTMGFEKIIIYVQVHVYTCSVFRTNGAVHIVKHCHFYFGVMQYVLCSYSILHGLMYCKWWIFLPWTYLLSLSACMQWSLLASIPPFYFSFCSDGYEEDALMMSESVVVISGLLKGLHIIDYTVTMKGKDLYKAVSGLLAAQTYSN